MAEMNERIEEGIQKRCEGRENHREKSFGESGRVARGGLREEGDERRVARGGWREEGGERRVARGGLREEGGERRVARGGSSLTLSAMWRKLPSFHCHKLFACRLT